MDTTARIEKLRAALGDNEIDAMLVSSPENRRYLSGFTGSAGYLLISEAGQVLVTELIGVVPDPGKHRILIDKGTADGVTVGASVVDSQGLFGQVIEVSRASSVVLLITDSTHATPVEVSRNNLRSIATGLGRYDWMELEAVPFSADIRRGDLVVSSGLGGRFPRGYPVGEVTEVEKHATARFATVRVRPSAALNRSRHVLVVFPDGAPGEAGEAG